MCARRRAASRQSWCPSCASSRRLAQQAQALRRCCSMLSRRAGACLAMRRRRPNGSAPTARSAPVRAQAPRAQRGRALGCLMQRVRGAGGAASRPALGRRRKVWRACWVRLRLYHSALGLKVLGDASGVAPLSVNKNLLCTGHTECVLRSICPWVGHARPASACTRVHAPACALLPSLPCHSKS